MGFEGAQIGRHPRKRHDQPAHAKDIADDRKTKERVQTRTAAKPFDRPAPLSSLAAPLESIQDLDLGDASLGELARIEFEPLEVRTTPQNLEIGTVDELVSLERQQLLEGNTRSIAAHDGLLDH